MMGARNRVQTYSSGPRTPRVHEGDYKYRFMKLESGIGRKPEICPLQERKRAVSEGFISRIREMIPINEKYSLDMIQMLGSATIAVDTESPG
jgi:hypothetical protein